MLDRLIQEQATKVRELTEQLKREKKKLRKLQAANDVDKLS